MAHRALGLRIPEQVKWRPSRLYGTAMPDLRDWGEAGEQTEAEQPGSATGGEADESRGHWASNEGSLSGYREVYCHISPQ